MSSEAGYFLSRADRSRFSAAIHSVQRFTRGLPAAFQWGSTNEPDHKKSAPESETLRGTSTFASRRSLQTTLDAGAGDRRRTTCEEVVQTVDHITKVSAAVIVDVIDTLTRSSRTALVHVGEQVKDVVEC